MPDDDLYHIRRALLELESSVVPPDFTTLLAEAHARRRRRRIARTALVLTAVVAASLVLRWVGPGPQAVRPATPEVTQTQNPDLRLQAADARAAHVVANAGRIERIVGNSSGMVLAVFADCGSPNDCERGWRMMKYAGAVSYQDAPIDAGTVVAPVGSGFYVGPPNPRMVAVGVFVPRLEADAVRAQPGDVLVPWSGQRAVVFRATTAQLFPLTVPTDPASVVPVTPSPRPGSAGIEVAWSTAAIDVRGRLWVLASSADGAASGGAYTWVYWSDDGGGTWQSHGAVDGMPGQLLLTRDSVSALPQSTCAHYTCITGGIRTTDGGTTWAPWTLGEEMAAADIGMTDDGTIYLRDATAAPQTLRVVPPAGSVAYRPLPFPAQTGTSSMAISGRDIWVIQDVNVLQRSQDGGLTWTAVPTR